MTRFIVTGYTYITVPRANKNIYSEDKFERDDQGNVIKDVYMVPVGHYIGPNSSPVRRVGHRGKPREYYQRRNIPKHLRKAA